MSTRPEMTPDQERLRQKSYLLIAKSFAQVNIGAQNMQAIIKNHGSSLFSITDLVEINEMIRKIESVGKKVYTRMQQEGVGGVRTFEATTDSYEDLMKEVERQHGNNPLVQRSSEERKKSTNSD